MIVLLTTAAIFTLIVLIVVTGVFLLSRLKADNSLMDIAYGPTFAIAAWSTYVLTEAHSQIALIACGLVTLWALRLGVRILRKNWGKPEDARYSKWREEWLAHGRLYFVLRSYLQVNVLQGLLITLIALPIIIALASPTDPHWGWMFAGLLVSLFGLAYESLADYQLDQFIAHKKAGTEQRHLMTDGLFRYSRRPNYFGETLVWWGLALMVLPLSYGYLAVFGPLTITYIVTRITGPMLEDMFLEKYPEQYRAYMERTSYLIPLPPKSPTA